VSRREQRARRKSSCLYEDGEGEAGLKLQPLGKRNLSAAQHNRLHQKTPTATFSLPARAIKVAVLPIPSGDKPYHLSHSIQYVITARDCDGLVAKKYLMLCSTHYVCTSRESSSPQSTSQYHPSP
jgi:hypothetical protein